MHKNLDFCKLCAKITVFGLDCISLIATLHIDKIYKYE